MRALHKEVEINEERPLIMALPARTKWQLQLNKGG